MSPAPDELIAQSNALRQRGDVASHQEAIAILRQVQAPLRLAHTVRHLGDIYRRKDDLERAAECYDEALALYRAHAEAPPLDVANALRGMALLKEKMRLDATAIWREAKVLYDQAGVVAGVAEARARLSERPQ